MPSPPASPNFAYLAHHDPRLAALGTQAEQHFEADPTITLWKLRQFGEVLAQRAAAKYGVFVPNEPQQQLIDRLYDRGIITSLPRGLLHDLRRTGNVAVHEGKGTHAEALHHLKVARELGVWFQRSYGNNKKFDPGPFVPPPEPAKADQALHEQIALLKSEVEKRAKELEAAQAAIAEAKAAADAEAAKKLSAEQLAAKAREDAAIWEALANESSDASAAEKAALQEQTKKLQAELAALQAAALATPTNYLQAAIDQAGAASEAIQLDEAATRRIIDQELRDVGWEADSQTLTYARGVRPTKGKNLAIAEWPTSLKGKDGWADYVLFAGLKVVGVVEAKRKHKDVSGVLLQAKRYSSGYVIQGSEELALGQPWGEHKVPFLFATNGRPFLRQLRTKSGIWFLDVRRKDNHGVPLEGWYTPEGLLDLLKQDVDEAHAKLKVEPMPYIDRVYQRNAILAVEGALEKGQRELLVAMATGTGKTRTCIGLCYRLLKTKRFRRILFLVDRNALGKQTADALKDLRLENLQTFTDIFDVKELADIKPDRDTKLHIATIQAMVKRVLEPRDDGAKTDVPTVDQYDCIIVDECHRGYLLDREMSDRDFEFRDEEDYISKYRRVLDHFDATKIGLTATPALHTKEIFGAPVFSYSYREAVVDGFLVDHEPPIRIVTKLAQDGIRYEAHEEVLVLEPDTQTLRKEELPDAIQFDVEHFNRRVITEAFNRAVLGELVKHIDPAGDEKTLVFAATDDHADLVKLLLLEALKDKYGAVDDDAVLKITGATDRPLEAIRRFRNERDPNIAITVDLLTTGIDVPKIANLVFLRGVGSRILYEQMIGRATRLCPEIGKERFRIFDAVDLYARLKDVTDMKPVVVNPLVTFEQLVKEIVQSKDEGMRREAIDEFLAKLQRKKRALAGEAEAGFESAAGMNVSALALFLKSSKPSEAAAYFTAHAPLATFLDSTTGGGRYRAIVSDRMDEVREVTRGYGKHGSRPPADYLEAFRAFLKDNVNKVAALLVVTQRPKDLTREDLRQLKLLLDLEGFNERSVQTAWRDQKNEDVAATIIGYIRQLALGSPLVPYGERVDRAIGRLGKAHKFTDPQLKWLGRIAKQVKLETVVDRASLDAGQFQAEGGFNRLNKVFDGKLETLLGELADAVWNDDNLKDAG
ncbi:MAG: type I restriction-modification system endonuclease [Polyangiaceae bacterium]